MNLKPTFPEVSSISSSETKISLTAPGWHFLWNWL
jgi:hypothetical protein